VEQAGRRVRDDAPLGDPTRRRPLRRRLRVRPGHDRAADQRHRVPRRRAATPSRGSRGAVRADDPALPRRLGDVRLPVLHRRLHRPGRPAAARRPVRADRGRVGRGVAGDRQHRLAADQDRDAVHRRRDARRRRDLAGRAAGRRGPLPQHAAARAGRQRRHRRAPHHLRPPLQPHGRAPRGRRDLAAHPRRRSPLRRDRPTDRRRLPAVRGARCPGGHRDLHHPPAGLDRGRPERLVAADADLVPPEGLGRAADRRARRPRRVVAARGPGRPSISRPGPRRSDGRGRYAGGAEVV
jgi:hypothetical protein